jgi:hypothetical protein
MCTILTFIIKRKVEVGFNLLKQKIILLLMPMIGQIGGMVVVIFGILLELLEVIPLLLETKLTKAR